MSILDEFYKFYDTPKMDDVIVGFSGLDPMPKGFTPNMGSISGGSSTTETQSVESTVISNHERLDGLLGGEDDGHYHLTQEEYGQVKEVLQIRREEQESGETFYKLTETQYDKLIHIIEAAYPDQSSDEPVSIIDCGEVSNN